MPEHGVGIEDLRKNVLVMEPTRGKALPGGKSWRNFSAYLVRK